ncbi:MAG: ornithine cyclodeaminase family protein [Thaumarchaeota archaeon]|nr:ornithine cyclodeaminase family protein [Nitrososphaerota archaeon]
MKTLVVGSLDVTEILRMPKCIEVMRETFRAFARGEAIFPPRRALPQPDKKGILGMMPGYLGSKGAIGIKAITVFPGNLDTTFESHQGAVLLFETEHGRLLSVVDAGSITAIRTAAASGVATDTLARKDVANLTILGSGTQANSHLEAMLAVRPGIRKIRVWSRNPDHAKRFAVRESASRGVQIEIAESARSAILGSDLICTTTGAKSPILKGEWLSPGVHINAVGASTPSFRELDTDAIVKSRFFVDSRESALNEADDFRIPKQEGAIDESHIVGEIGEVLEGKVTGRTGPGEITIFKSLGIAIEDVAAAHYIYTQASSRNMGTWVEFAGERHSST